MYVSNPRVPGCPRWRRKVALPFLFLFLQVFSVFSEKSFLPFCMGKFKKGAKYFSLSLSPGYLSFLRDKFYLFSSTLRLLSSACVDQRHRTRGVILKIVAGSLDCLWCLVQLVVADYIQSELQLKNGREQGDLHELDGKLSYHTTCLGGVATPSPLALVKKLSLITTVISPLGRCVFVPLKFQYTFHLPIQLVVVVVVGLLLLLLFPMLLFPLSFLLKPFSS
jgi:hypothetical protein